MKAADIKTFMSLAGRGRVATITPTARAQESLTFESYAELRDLFRGRCGGGRQGGGADRAAGISAAAATSTRSSDR